MAGAQTAVDYLVGMQLIDGLTQLDGDSQPIGLGQHFVDFVVQLDAVVSLHEMDDLSLAEVGQSGERFQ